MQTKLIVVLSLFVLTLNLSNPGILVTVPFPLVIPILDLSLPISIQPIAVNQLQLTSVFIRQVQYAWTFTQKIVDVKIANAKISFDWNYKSDNGIGAFTQTLYDIQLNYSVKQTPKSRLDIIIDSTSSRLGHSEVHIGGTTKQSVVIEITNLVMNHAAIVFRKQIQNSIKSAMTSFSSILQKDIKLYCNSTPTQTYNAPDKCIYMNTTLVAAPIINKKTLIIQINGAPYIQNQQSGQLNPNSAMIKQNSAKMQIQVHKKFMQSLLEKVLQISKDQISIRSIDISDVIDVDSQALSPFFPAMRAYSPPKNVIFELVLKQNEINFTLNAKDQLFHIDAHIVANVLTQNLNDKIKAQKYLNPANISASLDIKLAYGPKAFNGYINNIKMTQFECNPEDVNKGLVKPQVLLDIKQSLFDWLKSRANGSLNSKLIRLGFSNICAGVLGKIYEDRIRLQLTLSKLGSDKMNTKYQSVQE